MLNMTGISKVSMTTPNQILFNVDHQVSVGVMVSKSIDSAVTVNGRKIVKAGTPLNGDLKNLNTAFVKAVDSTNPAVGVLLHDVDVTDADGNGTLLIHGFVNLNRVDETTAALITPTRETELAGKVTFLKG